MTPPENHENMTFRAFLETKGPRGPPLGAKAPNSIQDSLNESSVRPNGTPVMPILRSRKLSFSSLFFKILAPFGLEEITTGNTGAKISNK